MSLDWGNLTFKYLQTDCFVVSDYDGEKWSEPRLETNPVMDIHIAASCLHYGQECFEGLKTFRTVNGDAMIFRPDENAIRMQYSAERICMVAPPVELFLKCCDMAVRNNADYIPPYGFGSSLYIRPLLIGTEATVGVKASDTYRFIVIVTPVGPYYKNGFTQTVEAIAINQFDRAAPLGTGKAKVGGNYAAGLIAGKAAREAGCQIEMYTDAVEHKYIDEFGTSNFIGITKDGKYKTPVSSSILGSITNKSLQQLAKDMGMEVIAEPIAVDTLDQFMEVGACGTAAVITPIGAVHAGDKVYRFNDGKVGEILTKLYNELQGIQYGLVEDRHNWLYKVEGV
jgi:branched-chain amino acid aminotransferase